MWCEFIWVSALSINLKCLLQPLPFSFRIEIGEGSPEWYKYFLCGVKGITEHFSSANFCGMKVLVSGNIPPSSGLSSSSALVSAATLSTSYANKVSQHRTINLSLTLIWSLYLFPI